MSPSNDVHMTLALMALSSDMADWAHDAQSLITFITEVC